MSLNISVSFFKVQIFFRRLFSKKLRQYSGFPEIQKSPSESVDHVTYFHNYVILISEKRLNFGKGYLIKIITPKKQ
jgi:hypothetical protein